MRPAGRGIMRGGGWVGESRTTSARPSQAKRKDTDIGARVVDGRLGIWDVRRETVRKVDGGGASRPQNRDKATTLSTNRAGDSPRHSNPKPTFHSLFRSDLSVSGLRPLRFYALFVRRTVAAFDSRMLPTPFPSFFLPLPRLQPSHAFCPCLMRTGRPERATYYTCIAR